MKAFALTLVLFALMLAIIAANAVYVDKTVGGFIDNIQRLEVLVPDQRHSELQALLLQWNQQKNIIQGAVSHTKIDTVSDLLASLIIYEEYGNRQEYQKTALLLCNAFEELRLLEKLYVTNIF